jgi:hypothetical protein
MDRSMAATVSLILTAATTGCSTVVGPSGCRSEGVVELGGGSCLVWADGGALQPHRSVIAAEVERTLSVVRPLLSVDPLEVRVQAGAVGAIPEIGMGGRAVKGETVLFTVNPHFPALDAALASNLLPVLAHELHHIARQQTVGYGADLLGAMVSEGLADRFSVQVTGGEPPIWTTTLTDAEVEEWLERARPHWFDAPYDHDAWFFGVGSDAPRWTGYAVGWEIVGRFLTAHPHRQPSDLVAEPSRSFVPNVP